MINILSILKCVGDDLKISIITFAIQCGEIDTRQFN